MLLHEQEIARAHATLSVVVPVFNEAEVLPEFHRRLGAVLDALDLHTPEDTGDFRLLSRRAMPAPPSGITGSCGISPSRASLRSAACR